MTKHVVDTNVPIAANGRNVDISLECRLSCIDFLEDLSGNGTLVVDLEGEVEAEYRRHLGDGLPGVGNRFLQFFFSQAAHRVERVSVRRNKAEFDVKFKGALRRFDHSDRKFAALSIKTRAEVAIACDSDWLEHADALQRLGVRLNFLCGRDRRGWFRGA